MTIGARDRRAQSSVLQSLSRAAACARCRPRHRRPRAGPQTPVHPRSGGARRRGTEIAARRNAIEHDPEKWLPVFGKDHAQVRRHGVQSHRGHRSRRLGDGAGAHLRARRAKRHAVGARRRQCAQLKEDPRKSIPARRKGIDDGIVQAGSLADAAHAEALLLVVPAQSCARVAKSLAPARSAGAHAGDRLRQGHRTRDKKIP